MQNHLNRLEELNFWRGEIQFFSVSAVDFRLYAVKPGLFNHSEVSPFGGNIGAIVCLHFPPHPFCPEQNGSAKYTTESSLRASHLWHMNSLPLSVAMVSMCHLYFLCSPLLRFKPAEGATSLGGLAPSEYRPNFTEVFALRF